MDKKFLDKVLEQIISETIVDYDKGVIQFPFCLTTHNSFSLVSGITFSFTSFCDSSFVLITPFFRYCKEVFKLNKSNINYVWDLYINNIKDKIDG